MPLEDDIRTLAERIPDLKDRLSNNEEATKTALVLPFFQALGYDYTNFDEVEPEFDASWADTKGWKADYALKSENKPVIVVECKPVSNNLERVTPQLGRYFPLTDAQIGLLTNGIVYKFFTDLEKPNSMDRDPFWEIDLESLSNRDFEQLAKFSKGADLAKAVTAASELNHINSIKNRLASQLENPDDGFVDLFGRELHSGGNYMPMVRDSFRKLVKTAFREFVDEQILQSAPRGDESLNTRPAPPTEETPIQNTDSDTEDNADADMVAGYQPTDEEIEGYEIAKGIVAEVIDPDRVTIRDAQQYCAVLLDSNNRRPLCRLHFNRSQKYLGLFDGSRASSGAQIETRYPIDALQDIHNHADQIRETARRYLEPSTE